MIESLDLLRHIYRVPAERFRANLATFRSLLDLDPFLETPVRQLSLGQRMRGDLAAALLHDPEILYLDEPTIGLDVVAKQRIRDFLRRINREQGVTVLLTTHDMADVEQLCTRLLIIDHGRLLYDGGLEEIRDRLGRERTLVVDLAEDAPFPDGPLEVPHACEVRADRPPALAALQPRRRLGRRPDRRRRQSLPPARPDHRGAGDRGHRAPHLRERDLTAHSHCRVFFSGDFVPRPLP